MFQCRFYLPQVKLDLISSLIVFVFELLLEILQDLRKSGNLKTWVNRSPHCPLQSEFLAKPVENYAPSEYQIFLTLSNFAWFFQFLTKYFVQSCRCCNLQPFWSSFSNFQKNTVNNIFGRLSSLLHLILPFTC